MDLFAFVNTLTCSLKSADTKYTAYLFIQHQIEYEFIMMVLLLMKIGVLLIMMIAVYFFGDAFGDSCSVAVGSISGWESRMCKK